MNRIKEYLTIEIFIILPLLFLIISLLVLLTTNGQLDLGEFGLIGIFTLLSSIGTVAAALAAWKAVNTNLIMYEEQKQESIESYLPLFEVESRDTGLNYVTINLINRNPKPISIFQYGSNSKEDGMELQKREVNVFRILIFGSYEEQESFNVWLHYKTLDRKSYSEQIKFRIVEGIIVIEEQTVKLI